MKTINVYGINPIESIIEKKPSLIKEIFIVENCTNNRILKIISKLRTLNINHFFISKVEIENKLKTTSHQGIFGSIFIEKYKSFKELNGFIKNSNINDVVLILDCIQDPRNLGSCLRTANAADVKAVIINKNNSAPINELVFKTSVGAILDLEIFIVPNLVNAIKLLKDNNYWVTGLDGNAKKSFYDISFNSATAVVLGSEGAGMKKITSTNCDLIASIPISPNIDSLNVSVATGIALFEIKRQKSL